MPSLSAATLFSLTPCRCACLMEHTVASLTLWLSSLVKCLAAAAIPCSHVYSQYLHGHAHCTYCVENTAHIQHNRYSCHVIKYTSTGTSIDITPMYAATTRYPAQTVELKQMYISPLVWTMILGSGCFIDQILHFPVSEGNGLRW